METNNPTDQFLTAEEVEIGRRFVDDGHIVVPAEDRSGLDRIRSRVAELASDHLGLGRPDDPGRFLDGIGTHVGVDQLNAVRMAVINGLRGDAWFRPVYHGIVRQALCAIVGNELAMQRGVGISLQLPGDTSSLLSIHADVWDGDSPFEVVVWVPLVDCYRTKSMYLVPPEKSRTLHDRIHKLQKGSAEDLYQSVKEDARFLDVAYGQILLFSQTLMHGNRVNEEDTTRWSMNCRFKSVLSPYADKRLGEFFEPITIRPATRIGMDYSLPEGFDE